MTGTLSPGQTMEEVCGKIQAWGLSGKTVGLECEEAHLFSPLRTLDIAFEPGMVLDIEVWKIFKEFNLAGIEDCYRARGAGLERLSTFARGLLKKRSRRDALRSFLQALVSILHLGASARDTMRDSGGRAL